MHSTLRQKTGTCLVAAAALLTALTPTSTQAAVFLNLSSANVIGGSPVFFNSVYNAGGPSGYQAGNIFNQQTGAVNMSTQPGNAWFPYEFPDNSGTANRFVTIDLGAPTVLSSIEIFNSNQADRGTLHFSLGGGNSVQSGSPDHSLSTRSGCSSPVSRPRPTSLTYSTANPVLGQIFAISDPTAYRYLNLVLIDGQSSDPVSGLGLAEVRISAVPEPSEYAAVTGLALIGFVAWRLRRSR